MGKQATYGTYVGERVVILRAAPHDHVVIRHVNQRGKVVGRAQCVPASDVRMTMDRKHCTCRYLDHAQTDCPYPNGCTGCVCDAGHGDTSVWCDECEEWTVHPDAHAHS